MIREKVARALTAHSLAADPDSERPVDVIGAMGAISQFSSLLYRLKYAGEVRPSDIERAGLILARKLHLYRVPLPLMIKRAAMLAVNEWLLDRCSLCRGRGTLGGRGELTAIRRRPCKVCQATGLVRRRTPRGFQLITSCRHCNGRSYAEIARTIQDDSLRLCHVCGGTGQLVLSDAERGRLLGIGTAEARTLRKHIDRGLDILRQSDCVAAVRLREQLANVENFDV